ncbi:MAG: putative manganese-dependent inorganic diphosphatase [Eubacteriales bacterium]|nr:putative manganese-dependent inorganic diphosphatase [Eubacteriales bacterium]
MAAEVFVTGHLNPDTDSICSALAFAAYQQAIGQPAKAVRAGSISPETQWILDRFKVEAPPLIRDLRTQIQDLKLDTPRPLTPYMPLRKAWEAMRQTKVKSIPVVDQHQKLIGIVSLGDLAEFDIAAETVHTIQMPAENLVEMLYAKVSGTLPKTFQANYFWYNEQDIIPAKSNVFVDKITQELVGQAVASRAACIVLCAGNDADLTNLPPKEIADMADKVGMPILVTAMRPYYAIRYAQQAVPIKVFMKSEKLMVFSATDFVDDVRESMLSTRFRSYPVVDSDNRVLGTISRFHLLQSGRKKVMLVDHNERSQAVRGIEQAEILAIIDHHRLGDVQTYAQVYFRCEPVGCTSTIIAGMFFERNLVPDPPIAGLMLSAILSDTQLFKSPTCTSKDVQMAEKLAVLADVNLKSHGHELFRASSNLYDKTPKEMFFLDFKEFFLGDYKIGVSQINCLDGAELADKTAAIPKLMDDLVEAQRFDLLLFMETDILKEGTQLYYSGRLRRELAQAFNLDPEDIKAVKSFFLPGVMSRKKQVIPALGNHLR